MDTRDPLSIAQHADDPSYTFASGGTAQVDGKNAEILQIGAGDQKLVWDIDPETGRVLRASYDGMTQTGPAKMQDTYSDWKSSGGITLPAHCVRTANGKEVMSYDVTSFTVNPTVDPKMFEKPSSAAPQ